MLAILQTFKRSKQNYKFTFYIVGNYATYDGFVNGAENIFKASTTYNDKTIIRKIFQNFKIGILIKKSLLQ
jgi:hypothetical protein